MEHSKFIINNDFLPMIKTENEHESHEISYITFGDPNSKKSLICLHGLTRNGRDFDYLAKEMSKTHYVVCPDISGRRNSSYFKNSQNYALENYTAIVMGLINELNLNNIDVVGTSMGGMITMAIASIDPNFFNKIVINDVGPFIPGDALTRISKYVGIAPEFNDLNHAKEHLKIILSGFGISEDQHWEHMTKHSFYKNDNNKFQLCYDIKIAQNFNQSGEKMENIEFWDIWHKINNEILLIRGSDSDILLEETANKMINSKNNIELVTFPNVGHAPALMENDQIEIIAHFLRK